MKKMMMAVGFAAMVAAAGMMTFTGCDICVACSSTRGGEPDFLDCTVPKLAIPPSMSFFDAMSYLEDYALNPPTMDGIDGKGRIKVEYYYGVNYIGPLGAVVETDISVHTALRDIASRAGAICGWNPERRIVTFLVKGKCHPKTWEELIDNIGMIVYDPCLPSLHDKETERSNPRNPLHESTCPPPLCVGGAGNVANVEVLPRPIPIANERSESW